MSVEASTMDFELSEDQVALRGLAEDIIGAHAPIARPRDVDPAGTALDRELWQALAAADLLGAPLPADAGGMGLGILEACVVAEVVGRYVAPVPYMETVVQGAMTLAAFGGDAHRELVRSVASGATIVTAALQERWWSGVQDPATVAHRDGSCWRIQGVKDAVAYAPMADHFVVSVQMPNGTAALCVVDGSDPAVSVEAEVGTNHVPMGQVHFDGVAVEDTAVLGGEVGGDDDGTVGGAEALRWLYRHGVAAMCATASGVLQGGLALTAQYMAQREQFGRPIATFQGAAMRIADAYIDTEAVSLTTWSAIWRLATGRPADQELAMAKFWVADGGQRAVHAFQHLHGGIGVDESYPVHRYFTWAKAMELGLGGATQQLLDLGGALAGEGTDVH